MTEVKAQDRERARMLAARCDCWCPCPICTPIAAKMFAEAREAGERAAAKVVAETVQS